MSDDSDTCMHILALITLVYQPITLAEIRALVEHLDDLADDFESIREIIDFCGSFLTMRNDTIYFVHQSARDFLLAKAVHEIFPLGSGIVHSTIVDRSLQIMSETLRRNIYNLNASDEYVNGFKSPDPDPLAASRYSCIYWIDHVHDCVHSSGSKFPVAFPFLRDQGPVHEFMKTKFLYWLEALSLCESMPKGVESMAKLWSLVQEYENTTPLSVMIYDAHRFMMSFKWAIESSPLEAYTSALLFSPEKSIMRETFQQERPRWITITPDVSHDWGACLLTLEGHRKAVKSITISPNSAQVASASDDGTVKFWDISSGACLKTFEGVESVAVSPDFTRLISGSNDGTIKIWDTVSGACLYTVNDDGGRIYSVAFSYDSTLFVSASEYGVKVWRTSDAKYLRTIDHENNGFKSEFITVAFSHDSTQILTVWKYHGIQIWDIRKDRFLFILQGLDEDEQIAYLALSHDSTMLATSFFGHFYIKVWEMNSERCLKKLGDHTDFLTSIAFSDNSVWLASASEDSTVKIWDISSGICLKTLQGHSAQVKSVAFSNNSTRLVSGSADRVVKIWDISMEAGLPIQNTYDAHDAHDSCSQPVNCIRFSPDGTLVASASDAIVNIWDTSNRCLSTLKGHGNSVRCVAFSHDSAKLLTCANDGTIRIWDISNGTCLKILRSYKWESEYVAFSHDSNLVVSAEFGCTRSFKIWDANSGECLQNPSSREWNGISIPFSCCVDFSHDSAWVAVGFADEQPNDDWKTCAGIWDVRNETWLRIFSEHYGFSRLYTFSRYRRVAFSHESRWLASTSGPQIVRIWDVASGTCLHTLDAGAYISQLSFTRDDTILDSSMGTISLKIPEVSGVLDPARARLAQFVGLSVSLDKTWIMYDGKKLLWLPLEYRAWLVAVRGNMIVLGCKSVKMWMCRIDPDHEDFKQMMCL